MHVPSLLIVIGEPLEESHLQPILDRILEGLTAWDKEKASIDLNTELLNFINNDVTPEVTESSGTILRSEGKIYVEALIAPTISVFAQSLQNFFLLSAPFKLIIHAGPAYQGTGSWHLRDGTFSFHDFGRFLYRSELVQALNSGGDTSVTISCVTEGEWSDAGLKAHEISKRFAINVVQKGNYGDLECSTNVTSYFSRYLRYTPLLESMPSSTMVGSIRFRLPTIYIFPAGQGDAALFGISGFTLLMDGGFPHRICFWDFLSHVDRIDAYLISRVTPSASNGANSFLKRLAMKECYPKLIHCFMNAPTRVQQQQQTTSASAGGTQKNPLLISVFDQAFDTVESLAKLSLEPHPLALSINPATKRLEPITVYQKVGHGRLDLYVLNPVKDSKELSEFTSHWKKCLMVRSSSAFTLRPGASGAYPIPLQTQTSMAVLIVWHPANERECITRVLYPGSCPQDRLFHGLEKLKHLDFLRYRVCTPAFLSQAGKKGGMNLGLPGGSSLSTRKSMDVSAHGAQKQKPKAPTVLAKLESEAARAEKEHLSAATSPSPRLDVDQSPSGCAEADQHMPPVPVTIENHSAPESQPMSTSPSPMISPNPAMNSAINDIPPLSPNQTMTELDNQQHQQQQQQKEHLLMKQSAGHSEKAAALNGHVTSSLDKMNGLAGLVPNDSSSPIQAQTPEFDFVKSAAQDLLTASSDSNVENQNSLADAETAAATAIKIHSHVLQQTGSGLNPEAPVFIPRLSSGNTSPVDFATASASSFTGGSSHPDDPPLVEFAGSPPKLESREQKILDQLKNEWGPPLGLPVNNPTTATAAAAGKSGSAGAKKTSAHATNATKPESAKNGGAPNDAANSSYVFKARPAPKSSATAASKQSTTAGGAAAAASAHKQSTTVSAPKSTPAATVNATTSAPKKSASAAGAAPPAPKQSVASKVSTTKPPLKTTTSPTKPAAAARLAPSANLATPKTTPGSTAATKKSGSAQSPPFYVDLTYVPHCGNPHFVNVEFFKHVRARYYVVSAVQPPKETLEALLTGKKAWNMPDEEITLIPTYDSETLNLWMALHRDELAQESVDVVPSCVRCTLNLEDHQGAVCAAYRLEL